jgi:hypothetical protein
MVGFKSSEAFDFEQARRCRRRARLRQERANAKCDGVINADDDLALSPEIAERAAEVRRLGVSNVKPVSAEVQAKVLAAWRHGIEVQQWTVADDRQPEGGSAEADEKADTKAPTAFMKVARQRIAGVSVTRIAASLSISRTVVLRMERQLLLQTGLRMNELRQMAAGLSYREVGVMIRKEIAQSKAWTSEAWTAV